MSEDQITALAREYAEECCPIEAYEKAELIDPYKEEVFERKVDILATQIEFEQFLEWLLRRYCLVEKGKVIAEYKGVMEAVEAKRKWNLVLNGSKLAKADLLFTLFPEIAKEVEP